jgi:transcription antitermination factor NusG
MIYLLKIRRVRSINSILLSISSLSKGKEYNNYFSGVFYFSKIPEYIFVETDKYKDFIMRIGKDYFTFIKDNIVGVQELKKNIQKLIVEKDKKVQDIKLKPGDIVSIQNSSVIKNSKQAIIKTINYKTKKANVKLLEPGLFPFPITLDISNLTLVNNNI